MFIDIATSNYATVLAVIEYYFNEDLTFKINVYLPRLFIYLSAISSLFGCYK